MVFTRVKVVVFVDGCYWHGCAEHYIASKSNVDYWAPKIARNRERDREFDTQLREAGWTVVRAWEHEDPEAVADLVEEAIGDARCE